VQVSKCAFICVSFVCVKFYVLHIHLLRRVAVTTARFRNHLRHP
jgi:hypothetical protein